MGWRGREVGGVGDVGSAGTSQSPINTHLDATASGLLVNGGMRCRALASGLEFPLLPDEIWQLGIGPPQNLTSRGNV